MERKFVFKIRNEDFNSNLNKNNYVNNLNKQNKSDLLIKWQQVTSEND